MVKKRGIQQRGLDLVFGTEPIKAEALELTQDKKNISILFYWWLSKCK